MHALPELKVNGDQIAWSCSRFGTRRMPPADVIEQFFCLYLNNDHR